MTQYYETFTITGPHKTPYRFRIRGKELDVMMGVSDDGRTVNWYKACAPMVPEGVLGQARERMRQEQGVHR